MVPVLPGESNPFGFLSGGQPRLFGAFVWEEAVFVENPPNRTPGDVNAFSVEPLDYLAGTPLPLALGVLDDFVLHKLGCLDGSAASGLRKNCLFVWDVLHSCLLKALDPLTDTIAMRRHLGVTRNIQDAVTQVVQGLNPHPLDMSGRGTAYMQNYSPKSPEYFELLYTRGNKLEEP